MSKLRFIFLAGFSSIACGALPAAVAVSWEKHATAGEVIASGPRESTTPFHGDFESSNPFSPIPKYPGRDKPWEPNRHGADSHSGDTFVKSGIKPENYKAVSLPKSSHAESRLYWRSPSELEIEKALRNSAGEFQLRSKPQGFSLPGPLHSSSGFGYAPWPPMPKVMTFSELGTEHRYYPVGVSSTSRRSEGLRLSSVISSKSGRPLLLPVPEPVSIHAQAVLTRTPVSPADELKARWAKIQVGVDGTIYGFDGRLFPLYVPFAPPHFSVSPLYFRSVPTAVKNGVEQSSPAKETEIEPTGLDK